MSNPRVSYDPEADAVYVKFLDLPTLSVESLDDERHINRGALGCVVGVELLCVSTGVNLSSVPHASEVADVLARLGIGFDDTDAGGEEHKAAPKPRKV